MYVVRGVHCRAEATFTPVRCNQAVTRTLWLLETFSPALLFIQILYCGLQGLFRLIKARFINSGHRPCYCDWKLTGEGYFVIHRGKKSLCLWKEFLSAKSRWLAFISNKKGMWTDSMGGYQLHLLLN